MAIEYVFWEERTPEVLIGLGAPMVVESGSGARWDAERWTARLEDGLAVVLDQVAEAAQRREASDWTALLEGRSGVGLVYDGWRSVRAWLRDEAFHRRHGRE